MTAKHPMIPFPVIVRAADGDIEAVNQIVRHYSGFIASRSMRPMKDEYGNTHMVVDETLRRRMETRLIAKILSFEIREPSILSSIVVREVIANPHLIERDTIGIPSSCHST